VPANRKRARNATNFVMINRRELVRSVQVVLLSIILMPCLGAAQEKSEPASSSSQDLESKPTKILKAPGRAVGASTRVLGKLLKRVPATATATSAPAESKGLTASVQMLGTSTSLGLVTNVDTSVGYNFTPNFGVEVGMPFFMVRSPFSWYTKRDYNWTALWGDPYIDVHYRKSRPGVSFVSVLTGTIPTASSQRIYSTGRFGVDWYNHVEGKLNGTLAGFTPFVNFGAANGTVSRYYMPRPYSMARPYQTMGFISDFEGGANYQIRSGYRIGASAYALVPGGPQTVYSKLVAPGSIVYGDLSHNRYFYHAFETKSQTYLDPDTGDLAGPDEHNLRLGSDIARDNGYSGWLEISKIPNVTLMIGYTRSVHYAYDALNVSVSFNATSLIRYLTTPR